jgi:hypothetical protein
MRNWLHTVLTNIFPQPARSPVPVRPALEQLEDRCVPSANLMQPMGMNMMGTPPVGMNMMSMQSMAMPMAGTNVTVNGATIAAFNQLFTDFEHTLQQVLASKTVQQFFTNEAAMIQTIAADLAHLSMAASPMGHM